MKERILINQPVSVISHCIVQTKHDSRILWLTNMYGNPQKYPNWDHIIEEIKQLTTRILDCAETIDTIKEITILNDDVYCNKKEIGEKLKKIIRLYE